MTGPRDWDKEMAEIDRLLVKGHAPAAPGPTAVPARAAGGGAAAARPPGGGQVVTRGHHIAGVWVRVLLGIAAVVALPFWPYGKSCGTMLYLYLAATIAVIVVGGWTMRSAWTHRRGVAHVAGLLVLLAGLGLAAIEILQRTSLVAVRLTWICP